MKKAIFSALSAALLFTACEETETTTVDITGSGTVAGVVMANIDQTDGLSVSEPVQGATVRISWDTEDLSVVSDGDSRTESAVVVTQANGSYAVGVPTIEAGASYTVDFDELRTQITYNDGSSVVTKDVVFNSSSRTINLKTGESVVVDYDYDEDYKTNIILDKFATIFGNVVVDSEQINTKGIPEIAAGAPIRVEWRDNNNVNKFATTISDSAGDYSINVPTESINGGYNVIFGEYTTTVSYNDGFRNVIGYSTKFEDDNETIGGLEAGVREQVNFSYDDNLVSDLPIFGRIKGNIEVRTNNIPGQLDEDPVAGVIIRFTWNDGDAIQRGATATTDALGNYNIEVPVTFDNTINVSVSEIVISNYEFNNGTNDVTGTATYNEFNTVLSLNKGQELTYDISDTTPNVVVEN